MIWGNVRSKKSPFGEKSFGELSVGEISVRGIVRSGNSPSGNCPLGKCLGGTLHGGKVRRGNVRRGTVLEPFIYLFLKYWKYRLSSIMKNQKLPFTSVEKIAAEILFQNSQENTRSTISF